MVSRLVLNLQAQVQGNVAITELSHADSEQIPETGAVDHTRTQFSTWVGRIAGDFDSEIQVISRSSTTSGDDFCNVDANIV